MRYLWVLILLLGGCLPRLETFDPQRQPDPAYWGPHAAPVEWWYISSYLSEEGLAFHWALFKGYPTTRYSLAGVPLGIFFPGPYHASHIALTDLRANSKIFEERFDFAYDRVKGDSTVSYPPLRLEQGDWKLLEQGQKLRLEAGPLKLTLTPLKPAVVHPPGYSGTSEVGRMFYVSYTRLALEGSIAGRAVRGEAWMDHQWGDQFSGQDALWDWFGLHLSNNAEVMLYRVKDRDGKVVQLAGTLTLPDGRIQALSNLQMVPQSTWNSASGFTYSLSWQVSSDQFSTTLQPLRLEQELLSQSTRVAYWEGPVVGAGTLEGQRVGVKGMGEFVGGVYNP